MKNSIARKITRRVSLLLLIAMVALIAGAMHMTYRDARTSIQQHARAVVTIYTDLTLEYAHNNQEPVNAAHMEAAERYGNYVCEWYRIDYAYLYLPDPQTGKITYLSVTGNDEAAKALSGTEAKRTLTKEELAVWNGETLFGHYSINNEYGHELSTVLRIEDEFGNAMLAAVDSPYSELYHQITVEFLLIVLAVTLIIAGVGLTVYLIVKKQVSKPAQSLSRAMEQYITNGERSSVRLSEKSDSYEFSTIASAFNSMSDEIDSYLKNIRILSSRQEHQQAELDIASRIQKGFLQGERFEGNGWEISAKMQPARDIGGDLYDYVQLDDHRVLTVIADVTGKGISAALFMAVTLILIRQYAKMELPPSEILRQTNNTLAENNPAMLFATAFVGIYDSEQKTFTYSNAGHNLPYIAGKTLRKLDAEPGLLLGLYGGEAYPQTTVSLEQGDTLLLYTDGVNEAVNGQKEFFGVERLEKILEQFRAEHGSDLPAYVHRAVQDFSEAAPQHDDITMLALKVKNTKRLELDVDVQELEKIRQSILELPMERQAQLDLCLAAEECFVNICSYAFEDGVPAGEKVIFALSVSDRIEMRFTDGGMPYDPLAEVSTPEDYDIDAQIGGLGKFISFSVVDHVSYEYRDKKNILTMTKFFKEDAI